LPALGLSSSAVYDAASRLTSATDALGRTSSFVYNNNDFLTSETDALNHTTKYAYDKNGNLTSITNAKGGVTTMSYDNATDWLLSVEFAGAKKQYDYNKDGTLSTFTKPDGTMLSYSYDELGRITSDGINSYSYDNKLRLSEISDGSKSISFSYDGFNRITGTSCDGTYNSYSYDKNGNCTSINDTQYSYDGLNRLTSVCFSGGTISYSYRKDSKLSEVSYPNGMTTTYGYDEVGLLTNKQTKLSNGTVIAGYSYVLDKVGNITEQTTQEPYAEMQLTDEETSYSYNESNRITKAGDISFEFDANGNTTKRGSEGYTWDKKDRLTGAGSMSITYDPLGLIASYGDITFTMDPLGIGNVLSDSKSGAEYIYGNGLEARVINGKASYYVTDVRGSVVAIVDEDGNITHKYQYDEFGKVTQKSEADYNPFQYVGKYGVMALNDHQYYMRARHYDPTIGRFLSEDPIWSTNLYPYADNNPVMGIDPEGLMTIEEINAKRDRKLSRLAKQYAEGEITKSTFRNAVAIINDKYNKILMEEKKNYYRRYLGGDPIGGDNFGTAVGGNTYSVDNSNIVQHIELVPTNSTSSVSLSKESNVQRKSYSMLDDQVADQNLSELNSYFYYGEKGWGYVKPGLNAQNDAYQVIGNTIEKGIDATYNGVKKGYVSLKNFIKQ
jgi:RHS repeat-associated protein